MIKITEAHKSEIVRLIEVLKAIPYGKELRNILFPPNAYHYADTYDRIMEILSFYITKRVNLSYRYLLNIRDIQIRELLILYDINFEKYEVNQKIKDINNLIFKNIGKTVKLLEYY